jgi:ABC-type phosphate transport system substrate-binding protein
MHRSSCALVLAAAPALAAEDTIQIVGSAFTVRPILDRWAFQSAYAIGFGNRVEDAAGVKLVAAARSEDDGYLLPDREGLHSGDYPLTRQLFLYARRPPGEAIDPDIAAFLAFAVSAEAQAVVEQAGFLRVPEASVQESLGRLR